MSNITHVLDQVKLRHPSLSRIKDIDTHPPYFTLQKRLTTRSALQNVTTGILYWFRNKDLRIEDNLALYHAAKKAKITHQPLLTAYLYCPQSLIEQGISTPRLDFILESLKIIQSQLHSLNIPLIILSIAQLSDTISNLVAFLEKYHISDLYANYEYETDELMRDIHVVENLPYTINCFYYHDQCLIEPEVLVNKQKKPFHVFTPYHKAWVEHINQSSHIIKTYTIPYKQSTEYHNQLSDLFKSTIPSLPSEKKFHSEKDQKEIRKIWPAGHKSALEKLNFFIENHIENYAHTRSQPAVDSTSRINPYLSCGNISVRTILEKIKEYNQSKQDFSMLSSSKGVFAWIREIAFREFYREQLINIPHLSMNTPHNTKFIDVKWENDQIGWEKWCKGTTGFPWIDAGMRQLQKESYMHNRLRMNVASFLYHILLIDYRHGEQFFANMLIDWDLANNIAGWSPTYTIFNPILQSEKCDPEGDYIRKWVPELKNIKGKAIFDPYHRLPQKEFDKLGYPKPHLDWQKSKRRALNRFKDATQNKEHS